MILPESEVEYFAFTLTANEDDRIVWNARMDIHGVTNTKPVRELRGPCLVDGQKMLSLWRDVGTPGLVVGTRTQFAVFLHLGGNALVETKIAENYLPELLVPKPVVPTGPTTTDWLESIDAQSPKKAPTPKLRMKILKRDDYRCRVCGRRSDANVDVELHVHHFIPWGLGGLSVEDNLLTLCHTCHKGLDPHYDFTLAKVFPECSRKLSEILDGLDTFEQRYFDGMLRYRKIIQSISETRRMPKRK